MSGKIHNIYPFFILFVFALCLAPVLSLTACGNDGPVAPVDTPPQVLPVPTDSGGNREVPDLADDGDDVPSDSPLLPAGDLTTETIYDVGSALFYLLESGSGVLSVPSLNPDQFALHLWDPITGEDLAGDVVVVCSGGPTSLLQYEGCGVFENATFPLSLTAYVDGYAMVSIVDTNANVISIAMQEAEIDEHATIFGTAPNLGFDYLEVYTDTLTPSCYIEPPSEINPLYCRFEFEVAADRPHGFSAFLTGMLGEGEVESKACSAVVELTWLSCDYNWNIPPMKAGERRFYPVQFTSKQGPDGIAEGDVSVPAEYWTEDQINDGLNAVVPTAIFLEVEHYLPIGPYTPFEGENPNDLKFAAPYFEPEGAPDRIVMAGHFQLSTGETDLIHRDWHTGYNPAAIDFSGFPTLGVSEGMGEGYSLPSFVWTDPLGADGCLTRIEVYAGPVVWIITIAGNGSALDTADLSVPLTWLPELYGDASLRYRMHCIDAPGQEIDDYNEHQIIMMRREVSSCTWTDEVGFP